MAYEVKIKLPCEPYVAQHGQVHYDGTHLRAKYLFQVLCELREHGIDASATHVEVID